MAITGKDREATFESRQELKLALNTHHHLMPSILIVQQEYIRTSSQFVTPYSFLSMSLLVAHDLKET
ncbi:putative complex I assembly factor [Dirofilaria immitis]